MNIENNSKFKIHSPTKFGYNNVAINSQRLAVLPSLFVSSLIIIGIGLLVFYFNPLGIFRRSPEVAGVFDKLPLQPSDKTEIIPNTNQVKESNNYIAISQTDLTCKLELPASFDLNIKPAITKSVQNWWFPTTSQCSDSNLQAIQIVELNAEEGKQVKSKVNPSNIFLLSFTKQIYAIVYTKNNVISQFNFSIISENFLNFAFKEARSFDSMKMYDSKTMGDYVYYLSYGCQPNNPAQECIVWKQNLYNGIIYKLKDNIFQDLENNKIQVDKTKTYFKFAKKQDSDNSLTFITGKLNEPDYYLVELGIQSNSISSVTMIDLYSKLYQVYYR